MGIEFVISLVITVFSAGIVFGIMQARVSNLEKEINENQKAAENTSRDRYEANKELYQDLKRRLEENDKATQNVTTLFTAIEKDLKHITSSIDDVKRRIERLEERK